MVSQYYFRQSSDTRWRNSDEDDTFISDGSINQSTYVNDGTDSINEASEKDSETVWYAYSVKISDQLCYKLDSLILCGLIAMSGILY